MTMGKVFGFGKFERDRRERRERRTSSGSTTPTTECSAVGHDSDEVRVTGPGQYRFEVLSHATNAFNDENRLGEGAFSVVYRGTLPDGMIVAVKRMKTKMLTEDVLKEFESEIEVLSRLHHKNLVSLLGFCVDGNERILVYECMEWGTLKHHILERKECNLEPLSWHHRLLLALDVARAMEYLHSLGKWSVIHRDLKPSNILLDKNMRAKVADFGLLKVLEEGQSWAQTVHLKGTLGYIAPEGMLDPESVTTAMDVYSFGVILEVLITGKRSKVRINDDLYALVVLFKDMTKSEGAFLEGIDETLKVTTDSSSDWFQSICIVGTLALHCTAQDPKSRPPMGHIVQVLTQLVEKWERPSLSEAEESESYVKRWRQTLEQGETTTELLRIRTEGETTTELLRTETEERPLIQFSGFTQSASSSSTSSGSVETPSTTATKWKMPEITLMDEVGNVQAFPEFSPGPAVADGRPLISGFTPITSNSDPVEIRSTTARPWQMPEITFVDGHARRTSFPGPGVAQSRLPTSNSWAGQPHDATTPFAAGAGIQRSVSQDSVDQHAGNPHAGNPHAGNPYAGNPYAGNQYAGNPYVYVGNQSHGPDPFSREGIGASLYRSSQKLGLGKFFSGLP